MTHASVTISVCERLVMSELGLYILDEERNPVPAKDTIEWAQWFQKHERHVALAEISNVRVSTVFLGIDHGWFQEGPPVLFETMIFGGQYNGDQWRYSTWAEAVKGHETAVELVRKSAPIWRVVQTYRNLKRFCELLVWRCYRRNR